MKTIYLLLFIMIISACSSKKKNETKISPIKLPANRIEGFFEIKWGDDVESSKMKILQKFPNSRLIISDVNMLVFTEEIKLLDRELAVLTLEFTSKGFCRCIGQFEKLPTEKSISFYKELSEMFVSKYGKPTYGGLAGESMLWVSVDSCYISIDPGNIITISYRNEPRDKMYSSEVEENKTKNEEIRKQQIMKEL